MIGEETKACLARIRNDSVRYWERKRIWYNLALTAATALGFLTMGISQLFPPESDLVDCAALILGVGLGCSVQ